VRTPPHCSADGKVLLAFGALALPGGELAARTARTVRDREVLRGELERARERGFAVARGELEEGLHGIAAPVWRAEVCVAALCLSGPEYRLRGSFEDELAGPLLLASEELGRRLSGTAT
jgi:DNA-binding IclR family transcriptional regulator